MKYKRIPFVHLVLFTVLITPDITQRKRRRRMVKPIMNDFSEKTRQTAENKLTFDLSGKIEIEGKSRQISEK